MVVGATFGKQSVRQSARRSALDAQAKMRAERVERERRLSVLGVTVMVALGERDQLVSRCEERAGAALATMVEQEGLSLAQAAAWCGPDLSRREAARLRWQREVAAVSEAETDGADEGEHAEGSAAPIPPEPSGSESSGSGEASGAGHGGPRSGQ